MKWIRKCKNIVDEPADVLVCSANVSLNLSGGVGAELLGRYGMTMQKALHDVLSNRDKHYAQPGEIIAYCDPCLPYKAVLHAVAVNGFYESSPLIIEQIVRKSLNSARDYGAKCVALTALATGYGNLSLSEFADGIRPLFHETFHPIEQVSICLMEDYRVEQLATFLPEMQLVS